MAIRAAINGFGRIGRNVLRSAKQEGNSDIDFIAVNDLTSPHTLAHLLKYDSVHGTLPMDVSVDGDTIKVGGQSFKVTAIRDPKELPHKENNVDIAMECTGIFASKEKASAHLEAGAKRVLVSAPAAGADKTIVYGVNHDEISADHLVISNASCTTNCLAPVAKVMSDSVGIEAGYMTTIHAYTGDQPTLDTSHKDLRRARAAAMSMIPTSTGAARSVGEVLPHLKGKMNGSAIRVPTANVSVVDFGFTAERDTGTDEINALLRAAAEGPMKGVLSVNDRPLVSVDFNHDPNSSIADLTQTHVMNNRLVRVLAWYDNEWGFSCRMLDNAAEIGKTL